MLGAWCFGVGTRSGNRNDLEEAFGFYNDIMSSRYNNLTR
jgi:hypothetical protein